MQAHMYIRELWRWKNEPNWGAHQGVAVTTTVELCPWGLFAWLQRYTTLDGGGRRWMLTA